MINYNNDELNELIYSLQNPGFDFNLPQGIKDMVEELVKGIQNKITYLDCIQDEIRSLAHGYTDLYLTEEQAEEVITFYCRKRFL